MKNDNGLSRYWTEPRPDGDYLMTVDDDQGDEREVGYLGEGSSLQDSYDAAIRDISDPATNTHTEYDKWQSSLIYGWRKLYRNVYGDENFLRSTTREHLLLDEIRSLRDRLGVTRGVAPRPVVDRTRSPGAWLGDVSTPKGTDA